MRSIEPSSILATAAAVGLLLGAARRPARGIAASRPLPVRCSRTAERSR